eukprot:TRINITY_DN17331_c0_g1_i1.p1 TRINITY_DN17331_c0_g1~~TRINITY_DN17331_c0_g1_i1.p1  ORF type:complete len:492 (+),score=27.90 TRINITY_DN17331_c0_g1_i1:49-1524(+)
MQRATPDGTAPVWVPYENRNRLERLYVPVRWKAATLLQNYAIVNDYITLTYGEALMLLPFLLFITMQGFNRQNHEGMGKTGHWVQGPLVLTIATACKNSPLTFLLGVPVERRLWYHKVSAVMTILNSYYHIGMCYLIDTWRGDSAGSKAELTGWIAMGCLSLLVASGHPGFRRSFYNTFYYSHVALILASIVALMFHKAYYVMIGVGFWTADVLVRFLYGTFGKLPRKGFFDPIPGGRTVKIRIYTQHRIGRPGQYVYLTVPELTYFESHPFTISRERANPDRECGGYELTLMIRVLGDWTNGLHELALRRPPDNNGYDLLLQGPYGEPRLDVEGDRYQHFVMVSGGVGLTPWLYLVHDLLEQSSRGRVVSRVWFCWSVRCAQMLDAFVNCVPVNERVATHFCLTGPSGAASGCIPHVSPTIQLARLDPQPYLAAIRKEILVACGTRSGDSEEVAVLFCGPPRFGEAVRKACLACSGDGVAFDFHTEVFEF